MTDEPWLRDALDCAFPDTHPSPDWRAVLSDAGSHPLRSMTSPAARPGRRWSRSALLAAALIAVLVPAFAYSSDLRGLLGFPQPDLSRSKLLVSAPLADGRSVRLWLAPAPDGECVFQSSNRDDTDVRPARMNGGGQCATTGHGVMPHAEDSSEMEAGVSLSRRTTSDWTPPTLSGWIPPALNAARVELHWRRGRTSVAFRNDYFLGVPKILDHPAFEDLPIYVVAFTSNGAEVARRKIPSLGLYLDRTTKERLRRFVREHPGRHIM